MARLSKDEAPAAGGAGAGSGAPMSAMDDLKKEEDRPDDGMDRAEAIDAGPVGGGARLDGAQGRRVREPGGERQDARPGDARGADARVVPRDVPVPAARGHRRRGRRDGAGARAGSADDVAGARAGALARRRAGRRRDELPGHAAGVRGSGDPAVPRGGRRDPAAGAAGQHDGRGGDRRAGDRSRGHGRGRGRGGHAHRRARGAPDPGAGQPRRVRDAQGGAAGPDQAARRPGRGRRRRAHDRRPAGGPADHHDPQRHAGRAADALDRGPGGR